MGKWEGDVLVIDVRNFVEDTWFGEKGYFHTDAMRVTERLWLDGDNLVWQATVHDPNVLTAPWTLGAANDFAFHPAARRVAALPRTGRRPAAQQRPPRAALSLVACSP